MPPGMRHKRVAMRKFRSIAAALAAGLLLAALGVWWQNQQAWLAAYWEGELAQCGDEDAARICQRLAGLGEPGFAALAREMGGERGRVVAAADRTLDDEIELAGHRPALEAKQRLTELAEALAENVERLPPAPRQRAARLAMKILLCRRAHGVVDGGRLAAACDRILRTARHRPAIASAAKPSAVAKRATKARSATAIHSQPTPRPPDHSMLLELAELKPPDLPRANNLVNGGEAPRVLGSFEGRALVAVHDRPITKPPPAAEGHVTTAGYTRRKSNDEPSGDTSADFRTADAQKLFNLLNDQESGRAAMIELDRRGYSPRQIEIGKHLTSPDADERLRWTELLPGIRGIDARFWLLRLSDDVNVQVRRTAVGLLATDVDPEVIRRLRQIVIEDGNDEIRNQAARALEMWESPGGP